jgi:glycosyltransferase involved in cell wall biosynthesis
MKVLIVHNNYLSRNVGGEDIVFYNEIRSLRKALGDANVFIYNVSNDDLNKFKLLFSIWFSFRHYKGIYNFVKEHRIDIVHVHNFFPLLTPSVFVAAHRAGAKVVHTLHNFRLWCISGILFRAESGICELCVKRTFPISGIKYGCYRNSLTQSLLAQLAFSFYKCLRLFKYVDAFFVLTEFQKKKVVSLGLPADKIILKPNGVNQSTPNQNQRDGFIFVGRLEESKGVKLLLDIWATLNPEYKLTLIGEGELFESVSKTNIRFLGKKSHDDVQNLISQARFLIQPSLWYETFGLTIIEAMSCGTPVIGFNIGTRQDFIKDGINGYLCEPENLREAIIRAENSANYPELSKNARETASQFANEVITAKQLLIYETILNH